MDLTTLYRAVIMDHYKSPRNKGLIKQNPYHFVHLNNPSCGDDMHVSLRYSGLRISPLFFGFL